MQEKCSFHVRWITFRNLKMIVCTSKITQITRIQGKTLAGYKNRIQESKYLNDIKLLQKSIINASMKKEDGEYIEKNIDFSFVVSQIIQEAFDKPLAFFHLYLSNHDKSQSHQSIDKHYIKSPHIKMKNGRYSIM